MSSPIINKMLQSSDPKTLKNAFFMMLDICFLGPVLGLIVKYRILFVNTETIRIYSNSIKYSNTNMNSVDNCNIGILRCFYNGI